MTVNSGSEYKGYCRPLRAYFVQNYFLYQIQDFYFIWIFQKNSFNSLKWKQVTHKNVIF